MVASAILQWQVYKTSPCGYNASECEDANGFALVSPISIWAQIPLYALPAAGEVFVFVTVYEQGALTAQVSDGSARLTSFACPCLQLSSARLVRAELGAAHRRPSLLTLTCTAPRSRADEGTCLRLHAVRGSESPARQRIVTLANVERTFCSGPLLQVHNCSLERHRRNHHPGPARPAPHLAFCRHRRRQRRRHGLHLARE